MTLKRNIIAVTMVLVILLSLAGCGSNSGVPTVRETIPEPTYVADENRVAPPVQAAEAFAGGSGTVEDPYMIETAEQLALLAKYVNEKDKEFSEASYVQTADIIMNDTSDLENWNVKAPEWSWTPIGIQYLNEFQGHYNGAGYSISGMYIYYVDGADATQPDLDDVGLFGRVYKGAVENVTLLDSYVYAAGISKAGGVVGNASYSSVNNCVNGASITALDVYNVGGVCASAGNETSLDNCHNTGVICGEGADSTGGICGSARVSITNSTNTGNITAHGTVAGICGSAPDLIENCQNSGTIVNLKDAGMMYTGGIAGTSTKVIRNCHNFGTVSGGNYTGGIVGGFGNIPGLEQKTGSATLTQCTNEGVVTGLHTVGGIVGDVTIYNGDLTVSDCINRGAVSGSDDQSGVGGIAGCLGGMGACSDGSGLLLENCQNFGEISHEYDAGGIVGTCSAAKAPVTIQNCSNMGKIIATTNSGGILGQINSSKEPQIIRNCENGGEIVSDSSGGGILGLFFGFALGINTNEAETLVLSQCVNRGMVSGKWIGGIVGAGSDTNGSCRIEDSLNEGRICGTHAMGGILGIDIYTRLAGGGQPVFYITRCVNMGSVICGEGNLPFDTNITYRKEFEAHVDPEEAAAMLLGGKTMGGITGGVVQSVIEDCVNCGEIAAEKGTTFLVTLADFASYDTSSEGKLMFAGAICGMYHFRDDVHTAKNLGIRHCVYADTACVGYSEFGLFEGGEATIKDVQAVSKNEAMELANALLK